MNNIERLIKVAMSIAFLVCLMKMPYGYYQGLRLGAAMLFPVLAYFAYTRKEYLFVAFYVGLAVLFQPFVKIYLGAEVWHIVDIVVGFILLFTVFFTFTPPERFEKKSEEKTKKPEVQFTPEF